MMRGVALAGVVLLAACSEEAPDEADRATIAVPAPTPSASPPPPRALAPGELPSPELDRAANVAGGWERAGDVARFGAAGRPARIALRCDAAARQIVVAVPGARGSAIRIVTTTAASTYPATMQGAALIAAISAEDRFVTDALSRAEGDIAIAIDDAPPIAVPVDAVLRKLIDDCREPR